MLCFGFLLVSVVSLLIPPFLSCLMFFFVNPFLFPCTLMFVVSAIACFHLHLNPSLLKTPAQKSCIMIGSSGDDPALRSPFGLSALPCLALSCTDWWLPPRYLSVIGCGVVHQNMGFLLTGITSVRSVSMRSRVRACPWEMTHPNLKRKRLLFPLFLISVLLQ